MTSLHTEEELRKAELGLPDDILEDVRDSVLLISGMPSYSEKQTKQCGPAVVVYRPEEQRMLESEMPITRNEEPENESYFVNRELVVSKKEFIVPGLHSEVITYMVETFEEHYAQDQQ